MLCDVLRHLMGSWRKGGVEGWLFGAVWGLGVRVLWGGGGGDC